MKQFVNNFYYVSDFAYYYRMRAVECCCPEL